MICQRQREGSSLLLSFFICCTSFKPIKSFGSESFLVPYRKPPLPLPEETQLSSLYSGILLGSKRLPCRTIFRAFKSWLLALRFLHRARMCSKPKSYVDLVNDCDRYAIHFPCLSTMLISSRRFPYD